MQAYWDREGNQAKQSNASNVKAYLISLGSGIDDSSLPYVQDR